MRKTAKMHDGNTSTYAAGCYDDACDHWCRHRSGARIPVYLAETETDTDGDIVSWHFKPVDSRIDTWSVMIVND